MFTVCRLPQQLLSHQRYLISLDLWSTFAVALCRRCLTSGSSTFWTTSPVCSLHSFILSFVLFSSFFCSLRSLVLCVLLLFTFFDLCVLLLFVFFCSLHSFDLCVLLLFAFLRFLCYHGHREHSRWSWWQKPLGNLVVWLSYFLFLFF